jgi:predicted PurR-regulated permease PerM
VKPIGASTSEPAGRPGVAREAAAKRDWALRSLVSVATAGAVIALPLFVWFARDVLLLAFAGVLFGVFFRRLAMGISRHSPLSPRWSLALVTLGIVGVLVGVFWLRGPAIGEEVRMLREELPQAAQALRARLESYPMWRQLEQSMPSAAQVMPSDPAAVMRITGVVSRTFGALASFAIVLFLGIVFAATPQTYVRGALALLPESRVPRARQVLARIYDTLWWWLIGRMASMTFIGVVTGVGLWLLGVPLAFALGLLAALLSFIPNLGPILAYVPAVLLALANGPMQALWVTLLYGGVQLVESYALDPYIDRKTVYLPPALTVVAQLVLALACGLLGVALAAPLVATLVVLVTMLYVQDVLGRRDVHIGSH